MSKLKLLMVAAIVTAVTGSVLPAAANHAGGSHPAVSRIKFKVNDHLVAPVEAVAGTATLQTRAAGEWVPLASTTVEVWLDGVLVSSVVTDAAGSAPVSVSSAAVGEHVVKVKYAGDGTHRRATRAQGFEVSATEVPGT